ncbi:envelope stress response membrane protein PspC [Brumicola pallidula]|jgi:phage shock protein C|uniref:Phage shock protein C n=1 Tax=Brumicola pallidula DSM 14239 = ACAM 615 TaxID=1121922 RepID=K6YBM7_9ALTE|nr:envelope stress response membrane protein PspC [Glaciecola pallidula]GAC30149.1 phage shock protein C [Glaciecola pallidula DSM 14239 = ACAM 615]
MKTGTSLYRDPKNGKIAGVCAGIADYFKLEIWLVRILTVTAFFLLAGPFMFVAYIAAWFILDKKPDGYSQMAGDNMHSSSVNSGSAHKVWRKTGNTGSNAEHKIEVKSRVWQAGEPPREAFFDIQERFRVAELKLRKLEGYVTSKEFELNREISRL